jgi:hypothetical protein
VKALKEYAEREKRKKNAEVAEIENALRWIVAGNDSIPAMLDAPSDKFRPLAMVQEKYTAGLHYQDSAEVSGYFATIVPTRVADVVVTFPVDKPNFPLADLPVYKSIVYSDAAGQLYFVLIYNEKRTQQNKVAATLAKIYRSDGLAWSVNYLLDFVPTDIIFKPETGEVTLKGDTVESIVDKNGKMK